MFIGMSSSPSLQPQRGDMEGKPLSTCLIDHVMSLLWSFIFFQVGAINMAPLAGLRGDRFLNSIGVHPGPRPALPRRSLGEGWFDGGRLSVRGKKNCVVRLRHCRLLLLSLLAGILAPSLRALPPLTWRWSNPFPHGNNIAEIGYGDSFAIEVTDRGQIYTSEDLDLWIPRDSQTTNALRAVTFLGKRIVVAGENGTIVYGDSPDDFKALSLGTTNWLEGVAASTNLVVAVGDNGSIYSSSDGIAWTKRSVEFDNWLRGVAFGGGRFVAVGEGGLIASSSNGLAWHTETSGTTVDLNGVHWVGDRFWVTGNGGKTWTNTLANAWRSVTSGATNDLYVAAGVSGLTLAAGDNELRLRDNSTGAWANQFLAKSPAPPWVYYSAVAQSNTFVAVGRTGVLIEGVRTNSSGIAWQGPTPSVRNWLWSVFRTADFYAAVGDHATILTSPDGYDWDVEFIPSSATNSIFLGVGGNTNLLVAAGNQGSLLISRNVETNVVTTNALGGPVTNRVSLFGVVWDAVEPRITQNDLQGVAATPDLIAVSGGKGKIFTSANGTDWAKHATPTTNFLSGLASFPGGWIASGDLGTLLSSADGTNWVARSSGTSQWIYQVRFLGGRLIAVGQNGTILTSSNGMQWTARVSRTTEWLNDVALAGTNYFIAGTKGTILTSTNAVDWSPIGTITFKSLYGLATDSSQLIAVGIEGVILRTRVTPLTAPVNVQSYARSPAGVPGGTNYNIFLFTGARDQRFVLERSLDLASPAWMAGPPLELVDPTGTLILVDPEPADPPEEFFRTRLLLP